MVPVNGISLLLTLRRYIGRMNWPAIIAVVFFVALGTSGVAGATELITLELTGEAGQTFEGDCRLRQPNGLEKRHRLKGIIPTKIFFPATSVRCSLHKKDFAKSVTAILRVEDAIAVQLTTRHPLNWILISSPGPWGPAKARNLAARPIWQ